MTRYYYTDPLAAAWMAKHFGMRFEYDALGTGMMRALPVDLAAACMPNSRECKFYIHPDSLHLLEPQVGDFVRGIRDGDVQSVDGDEISVDVSGGDWEMGKDSVIIIQRNNLPLHWPEVEA